MARPKQSFFGKIMGGDVSAEEEEETATFEPDEDDQVAVAPADEPDDEEEDEDDEIDEELEEGDDQYLEEGEEEEPEYEDEEEEVPVEPTSKPSKILTPISKQEEDWVTGYEGALNIDMYQTKDNVIIKSTIAGVRPDDIDITVANDMVTIQGSRSREEKVHDDDYFYQECYWGGFSRSVIVPVDIDSEHIEADLKDGILTVVVPKAAKAKTKKVKVKGL